MASSKSSSSGLAYLGLAIAMAGLALAATGVAGQSTAQDFVRLHNQARAADGVGPVTWDPRVAKYARDYAAVRARDCRLQHSAGGPYGENIFKGSGTAWTAADAVRMWVEEKRWYHYGTNTCDAGKVCGHYTQVVWRKTTRIGCARVNCAGGRGVFIICSYDPPGNFNGQRPFLTADYASM